MNLQQSRMTSVIEPSIHIHCTNGAKTHTFELYPDATIETIKQKLSEVTKVRVNNIVLLLNGAFVENSATIGDYDIVDGTTLRFEIKLCGPKPADFDWSKLGIPPAPKKVTSRGGPGVKKVTEL